MLENLRSRFEEDGFVGPFRCVDAETVSRFERDVIGDRVPQRRNTHLAFPSAAGICRSEEMMSICAELLGPDIAIWRSVVFAGSPGLTLHRDVYTDNLSGPGAVAKQLSVHVAVTASHEQNCLVLIPGSHRLSLQQLEEQAGLTEVKPHVAGNTRFARGGDAAVHQLVMQPGDAVFFHPLCVHGSSTKTVEASETVAAEIGPVIDLAAADVQPLGVTTEESQTSNLRARTQRPTQDHVAGRLAFVLRLVAPELLAHEDGRWPLPKLVRRRAPCTMLAGAPGNSGNRFLPLA